eukprot:SAG22_NODE_10066_length_555_cov_0.706140_1_plen_42_part_10
MRARRARRPPRLFLAPALQIVPRVGFPLESDPSKRPVDLVHD